MNHGWLLLFGQHLVGRSVGVLTGLPLMWLVCVCESVLVGLS